MAPTAPCRFFALGTCTKGSKCTFSHDNKSNQVCQFYINGNTCKFGSYCALKHIKPKSNQPIIQKQFDIKQSSVAPWSQSKKKLCPFKKECKNGDSCPYTHLKECSICHENCIDPNDPIEAKNHLLKCENDMLLQKASITQECVVCFELVKEKSDARFGLMNCNHCVCLECIRTWRDNDAVDTSKTCPICRNVTHFVVPSTVWPINQQQKQTIIEEYRTNLSKIDCRHYRKGAGTCPFSTSCFYRHVDDNGVDEKDKVRIVSNGEFEDEGLQRMKDVQLFDFVKVSGI
ncbi:hypothetical protein BC833DRAFT_595852 [Globomyces pollinis-pini]|nr:hypothetical protein BC833DRAFT_595852 [Globomyces pollinis-pini]